MILDAPKLIIEVGNFSKDQAAALQSSIELRRLSRHRLLLGICWKKLNVSKTNVGYALGAYMTTWWSIMKPIPAADHFQAVCRSFSCERTHGHESQGSEF